MYKVTFQNLLILKLYNDPVYAKQNILCRAH